MSFRVILSILAFFSIIGLVLFAWGCSDHNDSKTAAAAPATVDLAKLEKKEESISNNHVKIGPHTALYYAGFFEYTTKKRRFTKNKDKPTAETKVNDYYYPIVSVSNPAIQKIRELEKQYGSLEKVPENVEIPLPKEVIIVVKTRRYDKYKDLPSSAFVDEQQVQGLILNRTSPLGSKEKALMKQSLPDVNFDKVLILEDGRSPSSGAWCYARMGLGVVSVLLGIGIAGVGLVMGRGGHQPTDG